MGWRRPKKNIGVSVLLVAILCASPVQGSEANLAGPGPTEGLVPGHVRSEVLPIKSFSHMVVDHRRELIFVTGGYEDSKIVVLDFDTEIVKVIRREPGASGVMIHRNRLYVLLLRRKALDVIHLDKLKRVKRVALPARPTYQWIWKTSGAIGKADGKLWFQLRRCENYRDHTTTFNLRTGAIQQRVFHRTWPAHAWCPARYTGGQPQANWLLAWYPEASMGDVRTMELDLSGKRPRVMRETIYWNHGLMRDVAISPDGELVYTANSARDDQEKPYVLEVQKRETGRMLRPYVMTSSPRAVELSPDGRTIVAGSASMDEGVDLYLFEKGNHEPLMTHDLGENFQMETDALQLKRDMTRAFVVANDDPFNEDLDYYLFSIPLER